jgi:hypothetical protein
VQRYRKQKRGCLSPLVWIECQLLALTVRPGDKPNTRFELQIRIGSGRGSHIMGQKPPGVRQALENYLKSVVSTHNFGKWLRVNTIFCQYSAEYFANFSHNFGKWLRFNTIFLSVSG